MTTLYMAQDASVHENKLSVNVYNSLNTKVSIVPLVELFNLASQKEICTARGWLQRYIQELAWDLDDKLRAKTYMRSVIMGAAKMDAIIFVPIELVEYGLEEKLVNSISEDEKESIQDSLATVRNDIANGGKFYCIDGQNRIFKSIVPFMTNKFPLGRDPLWVKVGDEDINLANKKLKELPKPLQNFVRSIDMLVIMADKGGIDDFVNALIWKNDGIPWGDWMKLLTYNWHTSYRRHIALITESKGRVDEMLHKVGGQTYHHDSNGWEYLTSELLFWMKEGRWPKNLQDHADTFNTWKSKHEIYAKKLKKYFGEYAALHHKKMTHMEIKNYVILRYALDNRNSKFFKNLSFLPNVKIAQPKTFAQEFHGWHDIMKKDDLKWDHSTNQQAEPRWPNSYVSNNGIGKVKAPGSYLWANSESGNEFIHTRLELLCARIVENTKLLENKGVLIFDDISQITKEQAYDYHGRVDISGKEIDHFSLADYDVSHKKSKKHGGSNKPENTPLEELRANRHYQEEDHGLA